MDISNYFKQAFEQNASDLHLAAGSAPVLRVNGELIRLSKETIKNSELKEAVYLLIDKKTQERFERKREMDFAKEFFGARFRINLHFQESKIGLSARLIPNSIPTPESIGFNETIYGLTHLRDGLILVTGPCGCGKSTTLAAMINIINKERRDHIITIEDPIEFVFKEEQSIIEQRELGFDTSSFSSALKYALRQDPNVIMVGEMRDQETILSALIAAETGHLVLSTLHAITAADVIERIVDMFPAHQQKQIFYQIALVLRAVVTQQLLPRLGGGRVAAREIMINNRAIANLIRQNQIGQIYSVIQTSSSEGMIDMNKAIDNLVKQGAISEETAKSRKRDLATMAAYY
ncbi:PilT/PilU family type 4a pilus ATPase [Patescibacteria group bacterium]|nr:PilT/PilU family type 4a pilus ATPase [Candidatus Falkowbacteria bacterium]MBU3905774.1 PilT/PilU family type 4a pilus ATPase [Patescibacteria group bacterium]MCG2697528.1 PilT/PilU family type 4a pilus ATPase [Candidatus Parcubacteria bacterium]MBU4014920.1 PilT/PilU family type 4a pilus ATPase [Patescibacteria group bacterium]MBU4026120.1 PilT/PilU family type 4a pilus ATPase [Patescibacteria group bacterium]